MTYGTVGTSWITEDWIAACNETGEWQLSSVYSRNMETAETFAKKHGAKQPFSDMHEMAQSGVEAVYIASPNSLHVSQAKLFLENGVHVICEKPLAGTYGEMKALFQTAAKNNVFLLEAFRHIHMPGFSVLEQSLGRIAPLRSVSFSYNQFSSRYPAFLRGENPNVFNPEMNGGALYDIGIYPLSLAVALWGEPVETKGCLYRLSNGADGSGVVLLRYDGFVCSVTFSKIAHDAVENQLLGENGAIVIEKASELSHMRYVTMNGDTDNIPIPASLYKQKMACEAEAFAFIIKNKDFIAYERLKKISLSTCKLIERILENS